MKQAKEAAVGVAGLGGATDDATKVGAGGEGEDEGDHEDDVEDGDDDDDGVMSRTAAPEERRARLLNDRQSIMSSAWRC